MHDILKNYHWVRVRVRVRHGLHTMCDQMLSYFNILVTGYHFLTGLMLRWLTGTGQSCSLVNDHDCQSCHPGLGVVLGMFKLVWYLKTRDFYLPKFQDIVQLNFWKSWTFPNFRTISVYIDVNFICLWYTWNAQISLKSWDHEVERPYRI